MLAATPPGSWYRNLSLGSSNGLKVALVAYVYGSDDDLARGRTVAGTGKMLSDGTIGAIGGLRAKATAARDIGADVLLFPALRLVEREVPADTTVELVVGTSAITVAEPEVDLDTLLVEAMTRELRAMGVDRSGQVQASE